VGPPEEDIELIRHLSQKWLNPPLVIGDDLKVVPNTSLISETQMTPENKLNEVDIAMKETIVPPAIRKLKSRKVKRDDDEV
jgi:hypothetical protein